MTIADMIDVNEVVVPDVLFEHNDTIAEAMRFSRYAKPETEGGKALRYMAVLQGRTYAEFLNCFRHYYENPNLVYITTIGVPRLMAEVTGDRFARVRFLEWIESSGLDRALEFHCLGATSFLREVVMLSQTIARGIDTSAPVAMGLLSKSIQADSYSARSEVEDYFNISHTNTNVDDNIRKYLDWAGYEAPPVS